MLGKDEYDGVYIKPILNLSQEVSLGEPEKRPEYGKGDFFNNEFKEDFFCIREGILDPAAFL